jgi:hypothetical protein
MQPASFQPVKRSCILGAVGGKAIRESGEQRFLMGALLSQAYAVQTQGTIDAGFAR